MDALQQVAFDYEAARNALAVLYWLGIGSIGCIASGLGVWIYRELRS